MPAPSKTDLLPDDIRAKLQELVQNPRVSIVEATERINAILEEIGSDIRLSKSSVGRASQRWTKIGDRIRQTREIGEMFIAKVGAAPQGHTGLAINEILRTLACEISEKLLEVDLDDEEKPAVLTETIDQIKALALALQRLEASATSNVKREMVIREQAIDDAVKEVKKKAGDGTFQFDPEAVEYIAGALYGLKV